MIKLIVSDMDGTLLNDKKEVDKRIYDILPKLKEKNIRFVVASGRQYPSLARDFKEHLKDIVIIAENGALVMDNGKELYFQGMKTEHIHYCLNVSKQIEGLIPMVCAKQGGYTDIKEFYDFMSGPLFHYDMILVDDLYQVTENITKVALMACEGVDVKACYDVLCPQMPEDLHMVISGEACMDIGQTSVTKGSTLKVLQELWGISPEETLVFGDQFNDVEMFDRAYHSYAMENASEGVKARARFVAESNNDGGVVNAIQKVLEL